MVQFQTVSMETILLPVDGALRLLLVCQTPSFSVLIPAGELHQRLWFVDGEKEVWGGALFWFGGVGGESGMFVGAWRWRGMETLCGAL